MDDSAAQSLSEADAQGAQNPRRASARFGQSQVAIASGDAGIKDTPKQTVEESLRGAGARRVLNEIKRDKAAPVSVNVRFFATNNGRLSQQFIDFFELSPDDARRLSDMIQATRTEMWRAANSQAQVSHTETGGVVARIPPVEAGADIYDKVMDGFHGVLGGERFNDMMLYSGNQIESLFNQFGGEASTVTIEKGRGDLYIIKIETEVSTNAGMGKHWRTIDTTLDGIEKQFPEYREFVPVDVPVE